MNKKLIAAWCAACCLCIFNGLKAQQLVTNAGGYDVNNVSLAWSIGQVAVDTYSNSGFILTQGFHQSSLTITAIDEPLADFIRIRVYPNPTHSQLIISSEDVNKGMSDYTILMYNMQGSMVLRRAGSLDIMTIDMKGYAPSVYLLKVISSDNTPLQTFHIVKQ